MRVLLVSANRERLPQPVVPLGVLSVAASLEDAHEVAVLDLCFEDDPAAAIARAVGEHRPELVGVGIRNLHTNAYDGTEALIEGYRAVVDELRRRSAAPVVLGGAGFSLRPETLLGALGAQHGVVGEGERSMRWLVDRLAAGAEAPRLVYADAAQPQLRALGRRAGSDLDRLPPPSRRHVDPRYYALDGTDNVQTKRGCAFGCAYCDYPDLEGRKVRVRDPQAVADEVLARASAPGVSHIFFVDSVFNVPRSHALAISRALIDRGTPLPWVCYGSPAAFDDELVEAMARAGCQGVEIGSDSGTERMLERLQKPFDLAAIRRTRELFVRHGIHDCHTFVLGALDETPDEVQETLEFIDRLDPDLAVFIVFMEDREARSVHRARHREAILELLAREAPRRPGWVVPELDIRFGPKLTRAVARRGLRGPSWLHLARMRRAAAAAPAPEPARAQAPCAPGEPAE